MRDEKKLVKKILQGERKSLAYFYNFYKKPLFSFIGKRIENTEDAEEIMQDTLLSALEGFRDFGFRSSLFTYLCGIAKHKVIDHYRKKKITKIFLSKVADPDNFLFTLLSPEQMLDESMLRQKIAGTFRLIKPRYERILKMKYIYGYSVAEIAGKLSITFKSAESSLFRARKAFVKAYK